MELRPYNGAMRILVIRPGALGDVLLTLPALQALQAGFGEGAQGNGTPAVGVRPERGPEIEVMGNLAVLEWLPGRSVVSAVSSFDRADLAVMFQPETVPPETLRRYLQPFDLVLSYVTPPEHVFAGNLAALVHGQTVSFQALREPGLRMHMSEYLQQPLRDMGLAMRREAPRLQLTAHDQEEGRRWWAEHELRDVRTVAVHPGSGSPGKNWPAERFVDVVRRLRREWQAQILLLSGPAEAASVAAALRSLDERDYVPAQSLPLPLLAAILSRCQGYLGNDSGVSHLAAALGVPSVVILGPTDAEVWRPLGPRVRILRGAAPCAPCSVQRREICARRTCLEDVTVEAVLTSLQRMQETKRGNGDGQAVRDPFGR